MSLSVGRLVGLGGIVVFACYEYNYYVKYMH